MPRHVYMCSLIELHMGLGGAAAPRLVHAHAPLVIRSDTPCDYVCDVD